MTLAIELWDAGDGALRARYACTGDAPIALTFWWNRRLVVRSADGTVVAPGPGPTLPCGVAEDWLLLAPGEACERDEPLACSVPERTDSPVEGHWLAMRRPTAVHHRRVDVSVDW